MRSTRQKPNLFEVSNDPNNVCIRELMPGGRAGRITSGHAERKESETNDNAQWHLNPDATTPSHTAHSLPLCLPCGQGAPAPCPLPPPNKQTDRTVLVSAKNLKLNAEEHLACRKCVRQHILSTVRNFTAWFDEKLRQRIARVRDNTPEELICFLDALASEKIGTTMWHNYTHTPEYRRNIAGEENSKLEIKIESKGLATYISANCAMRTRNLPSGHATRIHTPRKDNSTHALAYAAYDLNKQSILMAHQMGECWWSMTRAFSTLGIQFMGQQAYEKTEELVGKAIKTVAKKAIQEGLKEEIKLSKEAGDGTYTTEEYGELPALKMGADAGWQRKSSGRRYDSASGCVHFVGVRSGKVCGTRLTINRC